MKKAATNQKRMDRLSRKGAVLAVFTTVLMSAAGCGSKVMDRNEALDFALADAGLAADEITLTRQELEKEEGKSYYEIGFTSGGYDYQYEIDASSGSVTGVSINALPAGGQTRVQEGQNADGGQGNNESGSQPGQGGSGTDGQAGQGSSGTDERQSQGNSESGGQQSQGSSEAGGQPGQVSSEAGGQPGQVSSEAGGQPGQGSSEAGGQPGQVSSEAGGQPGQVSSGIGGQSQGGAQSGSQLSLQVDTMDTAKAIALADAGLAESDVTFTKEKLDWDHGVAVYDIDFFTADMEYEYEIDAATGVVLDKEAEALQNPGTAGAGTLIGEDKAKEIAVTHAGFTTEEVFFTKIKLEKEHGYTEYEIEFYKDRVEYEYTIDASTGAVLEYESEYDD